MREIDARIDSYERCGVRANRSEAMESVVDAYLDGIEVWWLEEHPLRTADDVRANADDWQSAQESRGWDYVEEDDAIRAIIEAAAELVSEYREEASGDALPPQ